MRATNILVVKIEHNKNRYRLNRYSTNKIKDKR